MLGPTAPSAASVVAAHIAGVLLIDAGGAVLLELRDGDAGTEAGQWSLPRGYVEAGEDPERAARRILVEETG